MLETVKKEDFRGPGGALFVIKSNSRGLFQITMENGGQRPQMCEEQFTSYIKAKTRVIKYIKEKTQAPRKFNKTKDTVDNGKSEAE